ncbi:MAG TPA: hypothetical protein VGW38_01465 [Chloroflexota bacterium]|nr:hypothetical protein [Chloroflexota bacterium]
MAATDSNAKAATQVHPHPIRWDVDQQLWVCSVGCGFSRPKREGEVVPTREEAQDEMRRAGTGADFIDLKVRAPAPGQEPRSSEQPPPSVPTDT